MFGKREVFTAVDDVSFQVNRGTTLALVGESGSGKSTVGMMLLGLLETTSGDVLYEGRPVIGLRGPERLALRRKLQVVFQDPFASLNARMTVAELVAEEGNPDLKLRVFVQGGGCSGFQYGFTFDEVVNEDDTTMSKNGVSLLIDAMSYQYLVGAEIDYKEDLEGAQFVIKNPNASTTCGCGSSFSV